MISSCKLDVLGVVGTVNDNLLDLVELMNAVQSGRVLAGGAGFPAEAGAQCAELDRPFESRISSP